MTPKARIAELMDGGHVGAMTPAALQVWLALAYYAVGDVATPTMAVLMGYTQTSRNSIRRGLEWLDSHGYISQQVEGAGPARVSVYHLSTLPELKGPGLTPYSDDKGSRVDPLEGSTVTPLKQDKGSKVEQSSYTLGHLVSKREGTAPSLKETPQNEIPEISGDDIALYKQWLTIKRDTLNVPDWHPRQRAADPAIYFARLRVWGTPGHANYQPPHPGDKYPLGPQKVETIRTILKWLPEGGGFHLRRTASAEDFVMLFGEMWNDYCADQQAAAKKNGGGPTCRDCGGPVKALPEDQLVNMDPGMEFKCWGDCQTFKTLEEVQGV